ALNNRDFLPACSMRRRCFTIQTPAITTFVNNIHMSSPSKGNKLVEMELFVATIESGSFSLAARHFGMSPSAVSKAVARLEARLRVTLLNRSTRKLSLTPAGDAFFHRSKCLLADLEDIEAGTAQDSLPSGPLRINTNVPFGELILLPLMPLFQTQYPDITLNID